MAEINNTSAKKTHTVRNFFIIILIILCILVFFALASILLPPGASPFTINFPGESKLNEMTGNMDRLPAAENYLVKQKSSVPISISAPKGMFDANANIDFITVGFPMSKAPAEKYGWQSDWKVIVNSYTQGNTKTQIKNPGGAHTSAETADINGGSNQFVYYFTLKNLKEGDTFEARVVTKPVTDATYHFNESSWIFYDQHNQPFAAVPIDTSEKSGVQTEPNAQTVKAILIKDNGKDGAIIGFPPAELTADQKAKLEAMNQAMQGKEEFTQWWNGQLYPMYTHLPQMPPFKIVLKDNLPEAGYFQDQFNNAEYWNSAPDPNFKKPSDKYPDRIPY